MCVSNLWFLCNMLIYNKIIIDLSGGSSNITEQGDGECFCRCMVSTAVDYRPGNLPHRNELVVTEEPWALMSEMV